MTDEVRRHEILALESIKALPSKTGEKYKTNNVEIDDNIHLLEGANDLIVFLHDIGLIKARKSEDNWNLRPFDDENSMEEALNDDDSIEEIMQ